jgi:hypothetical protein
MFIHDTSAINHATKLLHDKNAATGGNAFMDLITARVNNEPKAPDKSPFFRQSPIAQDVLSYQPFDDQHQILAPFTRQIVRHLCGVENSQTVNNPGGASADSEDEEDQLNDESPEGNFSGGIEAGLDGFCWWEAQGYPMQKQGDDRYGDDVSHFV